MHGRSRTCSTSTRHRRRTRRCRRRRKTAAAARHLERAFALVRRPPCRLCRFGPIGRVDGNGMANVLLVALGGALGAVARFAVASAFTRQLGASWPHVTPFIYVSGRL